MYFKMLPHCNSMWCDLWSFMEGLNFINNTPVESYFCWIRTAAGCCSTLRYSLSFILAEFIQLGQDLLFYWRKNNLVIAESDKLMLV